MKIKDWTPAQLAKSRKKYRLPRRELGELLGVKVMAIYHWEKGLRSISKTIKILLSRIEKDFREGKEVK
jgi:DNA-binding transcriptional regulator YiaG